MADRNIRQALVRALLCVGICLLIVAGGQLPARGADGTDSATDSQTAWYHGFRFQMGGYVKTLLINIEENSKGQSALGSGGNCRTECAKLRSDFELSPAFLASTPPWVLKKASATELSVSLFLGGSTFSATKQKVKKLGSSGDADEYRDLGTGIRGNFLYLAPTFIAAVERYRIGAGIGIGRGQFDGTVLLSGDGTVALDSNGDPVAGTPRVAVHESSSTAAALLLFMEAVFGQTSISFGIGGPFISGRKYTAVVGDMRFGVAYEIRL